MRMKKMISAFLIVCMVISMIPMAASAAEADPAQPTGSKVFLDASVPAGQTSVWIDGVEYAVQGSGNGRYAVVPGTSQPGSMVIYSYHVGDKTDAHSQYPTGMHVWSIKKKDGSSFVTEKVDALTDILRYSGSSIRITGKKGIRMITSIDKNSKKALISDGLAGYRLQEYGTLVAWAKDLKQDVPFVLGSKAVKSNFAYKKGSADPVFKYEGNLMQYTNVLVGFTLDQCADDISMRPYMILENAEGKQITVYGGIVNRSIGYIAWQNRNVFKPGSAAYRYVWEIIRYVYAEVKFETNGGSKISSVFTQKGTTVQKPADPTKAGYLFDGWYADSKLTKPFDFTKPVNKDITLYAAWKNDGSKPQKPDNPSEADDYYFDNAEEVVEVIKAPESRTVPTEAEAIQIFREHGFKDVPIMYQYAIEGGNFVEGEASETSSEKHPAYYTIYVGPNDAMWTVYLLNGQLTAYPVSYLLERNSAVNVLISEDNTMTGYDMDHSVFYRIIPKDSFTIIKTIKRIDAKTLDALTNEEIDKL